MAYKAPTHPIVLKEYKQIINVNNPFVKKGLRQLKKDQKNNFFDIQFDKSMDLIKYDSNGKMIETTQPAAFRVTIDNTYADSKDINFITNSKSVLKAAFEEIDKNSKSKLSGYIQKLKLLCKAITKDSKLFLPESLLKAEKQANELYSKFHKVQ